MTGAERIRYAQALAAGYEQIAAIRLEQQLRARGLRPGALAPLPPADGVLSPGAARVLAERTAARAVSKSSVAPRYHRDDSAVLVRRSGHIIAVR